MKPSSHVKGMALLLGACLAALLAGYWVRGALPGGVLALCGVADARPQSAPEMLAYRSGDDENPDTSQASGWQGSAGPDDQPRASAASVTPQAVAASVPAPAALAEGVRSASRSVGSQTVGEVLIGDEVVMRLAGDGRLTGPQRAAMVAERIAGALRDGSRSSDFRATRAGGDSSVRAGSVRIVSATRADAALAGASGYATVQRWAGNINATVAGKHLADRAVGSSAGDDGYDSAGVWHPREAYDNKWVPIISLGKGIRLGAARVEGPKSRLSHVQAVAQLETTFRDLVNIEIYVPISTTIPGKTLDRVQGCSVTGLGDFKL